MNRIFVFAQNGTSLQQVMARVRLMGLVGPLKGLLQEQASTQSHLPYTNLKKSRPEKKLVTEHE